MNFSLKEGLKTQTFEPCCKKSSNSPMKRSSLAPNKMMLDHQVSP